MATREQLIGYRKDLADLRVAERILRDQRLMTRGVEDEIAKLADWVVGVEAPCLICEAVALVPTRVDDSFNTIPSATICKKCDAMVAAQILKEDL